MKKEDIKLHIVERLSLGYSVDEMDLPEGVSPLRLRRFYEEVIAELKARPRTPRGVFRECWRRVYQLAMEDQSLGVAATALKEWGKVDGVATMDDTTYDARQSEAMEIKTREDLLAYVTSTIQDVRALRISAATGSAQIFGAQVLLKGDAFGGEETEGDILERLARASEMSDEDAAQLAIELTNLESLTVH